MKKILYFASAALVMLAVSCGGNNKKAQELANIKGELTTEQMEQAMDYIEEAQKAQEDALKDLAKCKNAAEYEQKSAEMVATDYAIEQSIANKLNSKVMMSLNDVNDDKLKDKVKEYNQKNEELGKKYLELYSKFK